MDTDLKARREEFIHGHTGGTFVEVVALTSLLQLSHILFSSFLFACPALHHSCTRITIIRCVLDFVVNICPFLLSITIFSSYIYHILIAEIVLIIVNFTFYLFRHGIPLRRAKNLGSITVQYPSQSSRLPYLSNLMSALLLATSIAILAVDFQLFDRRFAKTEMYGWSLMDVGVGGFIAINGALSPEARINYDLNISRLGLIFKSIKSAAPMIILGLVRLASVKSLNYQEHVTEYGVHWNFFFTIAFSKLFSSALCFLLPKRVNLFVLSIVMLAVHQYFLTFGGLTEYILSPERNSLISANKEGIISTIGSVCLYLFFVQYGRSYLPKRKQLFEFKSMTIRVILIVITSTVFMFASHEHIEPTSRRTANFSFVCFMIALISALIVIEITYFAFLQVLTAQFRKNRANLVKFIDPLDARYSSAIFESLGRAGLLMFLASNLLTGAVNFSFDTLSISSPSVTLTILLIYCALITAICLFLCKTIYRDRQPKKATA